MAKEKAFPGKARLADHASSSCAIPAAESMLQMGKQCESFSNGNLEMQSLLRSGAIQARLAIGGADSIFERQADEVANQFGESEQCDHGTSCQSNAAVSCNGCQHQRIQRKPIGDAASLPMDAARVIQPKREFSQPGDSCEHEADIRAEEVSRKWNVQRCAGSVCPGGGCAECSLSGPIYRKPEGSSAPIPASHKVGQVLRSGGTPLEPSIRTKMESSFGMDFSGVRVHTDKTAADSAQSIHALAYTSGQDVVFNAGQYSPETGEGRKLLAHELTHVVQGQAGIWRRNDWDLDPSVRAARAAAEEERRRRHEAWSTGVNAQAPHDLANQTPTIENERERIDLAITSQRAAAFDALIGGQGWLSGELQAQGYAGPSAAEVKQSWAEAQVAAEVIKLSASTGTVTTDARITGLDVIPAFYDSLDEFSRAVEQAHRTHVDTTNTRLDTEYRARLAAYEEQEQRDNESAHDMAAEPGAAGFRLGLTIARGSRPQPPQHLTAPAPVSGQIEGARVRVYAADSIAEWDAVALDVNSLGNGIALLVVSSLPETSEVRTGLEYLTSLDIRLAAFQQANPVSKRIPAVFYPSDQTVAQREEGGAQRTVPQSIPWQFYLINTGVPTRDQPGRSGGEWVLVDLTSTQRFENRAPASDFDIARFQAGEDVDPPMSMFQELNSRIRFPEGRLHFTMPTGRAETIETTEPWSVSDWLTAVGIALAAIAIVASVIATGGASAPAAVAFYAGLGAAAAGIGSTLANLHERSEQGILTNEDVDNAMISIGIDVMTAATMGLGRLVALPGAAARIGLAGERFIALQRVTQVARGGVILGDVYQGWSMTSGLVSAYSAIQHQPNITEEERNRMIGQLTRRALLSGALLVVALRGDIKDFQAGRALRISHVDPDGALVVHPSESSPHAGTDAPHEHIETPGATASIHSPVEGAATIHPGAGGESGVAHITVGPQSHEVGVATVNGRREFCFCSENCGALLGRLETILTVLPREHPERAIFGDLVTRLRRASRQLARGEITQEEANVLSQQFSSEIGRHGEQSRTFAGLMNTDPAYLALHQIEFRRRLALDADVALTHGTSQHETQRANRGSRSRDPLTESEAESPIETDLLGNMVIHQADRPGGRLQPLQFDTGNFSHTYAEALVPGLPRGMNAEVWVTLPNGNLGRADRVRFVYDAEGNRIGAHVFEIKPNRPENIAEGQIQAQNYMDGLRAEIEGELRRAGRSIPATAPGGGPLYSAQVRTYNYDQMVAVLRALRASRRDAARMAEFEAIARQVFGMAPP